MEGTFLSGSPDRQGNGAMYFITRDASENERSDTESNTLGLERSYDNDETGAEFTDDGESKGIRL